MNEVKPMHFLVVSLSNIGDVVLTTPVMTQIAASYPEALMTIVSGPKAAPLLQSSRSVHRFVMYDKRASLKEKLFFALSLRKNRYEAVIDLRNTAIPFLVSARLRSPLFRRHRETSMRARHLEVLKWTGVPVRQEVPEFDFFNESETASVIAKLKARGVSDKGWILAAAGAASSQKRWPLERYSEVIRNLLDLSSCPVLLIGDKNERSYVEPLCGIDPSRVINLAGETTLRETAALIARCDLLLTNDSAAMHLGHELKRKVAAIFGPTNADAYGRTGKTFRVLRPDPSVAAGRDPDDLFPGVTPDLVLRTCRELLDLQAASQISLSS